MYFHYRCGERITLLNDNCTAVRNDGDFDHGIVISAEPLLNDTLFEVKIDRKVRVCQFLPLSQPKFLCFPWLCVTPTFKQIH